MTAPRIVCDASLDELTLDPHAIHHRIRSVAPLAWVEAIGGWLVVGRDAALSVMRDSEAFTVDDLRFSTAQVVGRSMLSLDGEEHHKHRAPFVEPFRSAAGRAQFERWAAEATLTLLDGLPTPGRAELRTGLAGPLAGELITRALALDGVDSAQVLSWYRLIVNEVDGISRGSTSDGSGHAAFRNLTATVERTIGASSGSLLGSAAETLSDAEITSNAAVLMFGAIETSEGAITNLLHFLLNDRRQLELVVERPELLANALEESLRLEPSAAVVHRYATRDVKVADVAISEGDFLSVSLAGANRDPTFFDDPDRFDVRRSNARQHVAFAYGPHACLGIHVARLETLVAVRTILDQRPNIQLDIATTEKPTGLIFRKPQSLWVDW